MINNTTTYNEEAISALNTHTSKKHIKWFIFSIMLLVFLFIETLYNKPSGYTIYITFYIILLVFLVGSMGFTIYTNRRRLKDSSGVINTTLNFSFNDDGCKIIVLKNENENNILTLPYTQIKKVVEKGNYCFIYISTSSSLILDKRGFEKEDEIDQLKILLTKHKVKITY